MDLIPEWLLFSFLHEDILDFHPSSSPRVVQQVPMRLKTAIQGFPRIDFSLTEATPRLDLTWQDGG